MSQLLPSNTTVGDICTASLEECGRLGIGQTAEQPDLIKAWARLQWMLQQWQQKRWLVYHLVTYSVNATGATSYTFGPGGQINTNVVAAWSLTSLSPLVAGSGYIVGEVVTLTPTPASGTPSADQTVQVLTVDSSGGITSVQTSIAAYGFLQFPSNPVDLDTITLDGVPWTFVLAATGSVTETVIQGTADLTVAQLVADLNNSSDESIALASYSVSGTLAGSDLKLQVLYDTTGVIGNAFTLAGSVAVPSAATLLGGLANASAWPGPLPNTWTQAVSTGAGFNATFAFAEWDNADAIATVASSQRPAKIESAFLRQIQNPTGNQVDSPLVILQSMEDYNRIALKTMQSFPGVIFLDSQWPLGNLFPYPVPQANIYSVNVTVREQLPVQFPSLATALNLPFEYYNAIMFNLALRLRGVFSITTFPGDMLPGQAKESLNVLRGPNTQVAQLQLPVALKRRAIYNIFSDQSY